MSSKYLPGFAVCFFALVLSSQSISDTDSRFVSLDSGVENGAVVGALASTSVTWTRFRLSVVCGLSLLRVLAVLLGFFAGFCGFSSCTKTLESN